MGLCLPLQASSAARGWPTAADSKPVEWPGLAQHAAQPQGVTPPEGSEIMAGI
jgi:hypothetical protein